MKCSGHDKIFIKTFPKALHIISVFCMLTLKTSLYGGPWGYLYFFNWRKPVVFCDKTAFSRRIHFNPVTNWKEASVQLEMINVYHCIKNAWNTIFYGHLKPSPLYCLFDGSILQANQILKMLCYACFVLNFQDYHLQKKWRFFSFGFN